MSTPTFNGSAVPILAFSPNWDSEVTLRTRYQTIVREGLDTSEERIRKQPRCLYGLTFSVTTDTARKSAWMRKLVHLCDDMPVGVPVWPHAVRLTSGASAGGTSLTVDSVASFLHGTLGYVLVCSDEFTWEVVAVSSASGTTVTLSEALASSWSTGSNVVPLLFGSLKRPNDTAVAPDVSEWSIEFEETFNGIGLQTTEETGSGGGGTYNSRAFLNIRPNWTRVGSGVLDDFSYDTQGAGRSTPWKVTSEPKRRLGLEWSLTTAEDCKAFRQVISAAKGRILGFYLPDWLHEYEIVSNASAGATQLTVRRTQLDEAESAFAGFSHLYLFTEEKLECYEISGVAISGDNEVVTLTSGLTNDVVALDTLCGGLLFARVAEDDVAYVYDAPDVAQVRLAFVELPQEYGTAHTGSAPIFLYKFTRGATVWRFANWGATITAGGNSWTASDITHGELRSGIDFIAEELSVKVGTIDATHPLRYYLDRLGFEVTTVDIYETDAATLTVDTAAPVFTGRVDQVRFGERGVIEARIASSLRVGRHNIPLMQTQRLCNLTLYSTLCGAVAATFTTSGTIDAISSTDPAYVEASEFGAKATAESDPDWFALGTVTVGTEKRLCVGASGDRLYLNAPFKTAAVSDAISATAGCNKRVGTCVDKFNNLENFMGFPYMPKINPQLEPLAAPKVDAGKKG